MKALRIFLAISSLSSAAGCEIAHGVWRKASLSELPAADCVVDVFTAVVPEAEIDSRFESWWTTDKYPSHVISYNDRKNKIEGEMWLVPERSGKFMYHNSYSLLNRHPDPSVVAATRSAMRAIEAALAARCGAKELQFNVRESCRSAECPSLATKSQM
jgi:hypothetical protein